MIIKNRTKKRVLSLVRHNYERNVIAGGIPGAMSGSLYRPLTRRFTHLEIPMKTEGCETARRDQSETRALQR